MPWHVSTVITDMLVDRNDVAFENPIKLIGGYYSKEISEKLMRENKDIVFKDDVGRGYRRMVPFKKPIEIIEKESILNMPDNEFIVIACGGGNTCSKK